MYQCLFTTNDGKNNTFAANVPNKEVDFLTETLPDYFGYLKYGTDVYDTKISAKEYKGYGKFHNKQELLEWLYENVFKPDFKNLADFQQWYYSTMEEIKERTRIEDLCTDILYEEYFTGKNTMDVWRRIGWFVDDSIREYNNTHPTKNHLRKYVRMAFANYALERN